VALRTQVALNVKLREGSPTPSSNTDAKPSTSVDRRKVSVASTEGSSTAPIERGARCEGRQKRERQHLSTRAAARDPAARRTLKQCGRFCPTKTKRQLSRFRAKPLQRTTHHLAQYSTKIFKNLSESVAWSLHFPFAQTKQGTCCIHLLYIGERLYNSHVSIIGYAHLVMEVRAEHIIGQAWRAICRKTGKNARKATFGSI
jgi:hypothetical protein